MVEGKRYDSLASVLSILWLKLEKTGGICESISEVGLSRKLRVEGIGYLSDVPTDLVALYNLENKLKNP